MAGLNATSFSKCAPSLSTNIKQCGTVALCSAQPMTVDDLTDAYMKSDEYRVMEHLLHAEMEIKQCEATQQGLFEFLMANKVNLSKRVVPVDRANDSGLLRIAPFIKADQYSPINNEYWNVSEGQASGQNWSVVVTSATNIPADVRGFPVGLRVYINGQSAAGHATRTAWAVVSVTDNDDNTLTLVLSSLNANSNLDSDKLEEPVTGYLRRGGNNVDDFEKNCDEHPAHLNKKKVPFWVKTTRWSFCKSSKYDEYRELLLTNNPLYREFGDLDETKRNQQLANDFQKRWVNDVFFGKALPNQTLADYDNLTTINNYDGDDSGLGVDGGICIGKRAEPVGIYEQMAECGRVIDLEGAALNLPALFQAFYDIIRVRSSQGNNNRIIDVFTDTVTAELLNRAMIKYYSSKSEDHNGQSTLRLTMPADGYQLAKKADFGFLYRSYPLFWPAGVTMNVLTHWSFDDELDVATNAGIGNTAHMLWVLDFSGIYPGIIATNRVVAKTGDLKTLSQIHAGFACVMKVHTRTQTMNSVTYTVVVECPFANLILENFAIDGGEDLPSITEDANISYSGSSTTTTTTAP